jgi:radical SAM protein with 4Fe4S-binding SPASM domain
LDKVEDRINCLVEARIYGAEQGIQVTGKWFKLLERLYKPVLNYCGRMGQQFAVDLDGNVFLCTGYFRNFGKIENWEQIIKDKEYINLALRIVGQLPECKNCPIECVCAGGCPASAESSYGSFYSKESKECEFRTKMVQALIKNIDKVSKIDLDEVDSSYVPTLEKYKRI